MSILFSKPTALSIGPQGCGTDMLYAYFKKRKDIALPNVHEIFYFDRHIQRGPDFYKSHFDDYKSADMVMELTTTAFDHPQAPLRVKNLLGADVKLFCPLRDPVERALAVYKRYVRYGIVTGSIEEACEQAPQILFASRYTDHLESWLEHFEDIHFISYNALMQNREEVLEQLCDYLGITYKPVRNPAAWENMLGKIKIFMGEKKLPDQQTREWLKNELDDEMVRLEKLLGRKIL